MKRSGIVALAASVLLLWAAAAGAAEETRPSGGFSKVVHVTATVEKVDMATRHVTVRGPEGVITVKAGPEVKNLDMIKPGDTVVVDYYEAIAWNVMKPGEAGPGMSMTGSLETAKKGEQPGALAETQVTAVTTIEAIDKARNTVTLKGPRGNTETIRVRDPKNLDKVKVGDRVEITYTEALAISVEAAAPGKGK